MRPRNSQIETSLLIALIQRIGSPVTVRLQEVADLDPRAEIRMEMDARDMGVTFEIWQPMDARGVIEGEFKVLA